ncbi:MAG: hypothetical protein JW846_03265 [Dehalococcoidia bacterium]|nr:hypothetical protein [Dehalococcoidia bacterium]
MRSKLGRLGLMTMAAVLAVGLCGAAFASWTDDLVVQGIVEMGEVNLVIEDTSATYVYKNLSNGDLVEGTEKFSEKEMIDLNYLYVASAYVDEYDVEEDTAFMMFDNIFPGPLFKADLLVHYYGVPAHVSVTDFVVVPDALIPYVWWEIVWPDGSITHGGGATRFVVDDEYQLHECETFEVNVYAEIPQDMSLRGVTGSVRLELEAIQWNLCEPDVQKVMDLPDYKVHLDLDSNWNGPGGSFLATFSETDPSQGVVPDLILLEPQPMDAWCCEAEDSVVLSVDITLLSSLEAPFNTIAAWNKINWVLNQPAYMALDYPSGKTVNIAPYGQVLAGSPQQVAFWYFLWGGIVTNIDATAQGIIDDAEANGATFVPGAGQLAAVICQDGTSYQTVFIALDP